MASRLILLIATFSFDFKSNVFVNGKSANSQLHSFNAESYGTQKFRHTTLLCLDLMKKLIQSRPDLELADVATAPEWQLAWTEIASEVCEPLPEIECNSLDKFRTIDGSCNNLQHPSWGQSFRPQQRFLFPAYDDIGIDQPRTTAKSGNPLPSARAISNAVLQDTGKERLHKKFTMVVMSFGQFLDHDLILTPVQSDPDGSRPHCCPLSVTSASCFPIPIPAGDAEFTDDDCMDFVRSSPVFNDPCKPGVREQNNELTSFIDGSNVYGSTEEEVTSLREFKDGLLKVHEKFDLPPVKEIEPEEETECIIQRDTDFCMNTGDRRVNEVPHLTVNHIVFLRLHNRYAKRLAKINPHWDDERIFQETRKIIGAVLQKIVYDDWLPMILNKNYMRRFCLKSSKSYWCRRQRYNPRINPTIRNAFGAAALRMGHSLIPRKQGLTSRHFFHTTKFDIEETFNDPDLAIKDDPGLARFVITHPVTIMDRFLTEGVRDKLFLFDGASFDLAALNIQRGRDHGIPPYTAFRKFCGLSTVTHFKRSRGGLINHKEDAAKKIEEIYEHPEDIDLFVGGLSETPLPGSSLGPTFSCLFAKTFRALKFGDRFFYEHRGMINSFSKAQINAIKRVKLSKIYCDNFKIEDIQCDIFKLYSKGNRRVSCKSLRDLDLTLWKE